VAVIVPVSPIVAVVDSEPTEPNVIDPVSAFHETKVYVGLGLADIDITVPVSYQPVSPLMGGDVLVDGLPPPPGLAANAMRYWVTELKFTV
jgi:hypothetical protein